MTTTLNRLLAATLGIGLLFAGSAWAERPMAARADQHQRGYIADNAKHGRYDRRHNRHDRRHERRHDRYYGRDYRYGGRYYGRHDNRHHRAPAYGYYQSPDRIYRQYTRYASPWRYVHPHGYAYRSYYSGYYLPRPYFSSGYYVDYHRYGLRAPPYGHHWVRIDGDVVLAAIATGLIVDVVHDLFH
ncbi:MAG: RcnB family protein [Xanthomonadales bacterium]|nr:RcnB family protein [Xanthomonadales bacterium]